MHQHAFTTSAEPARLDVRTFATLVSILRAIDSAFGLVADARAAGRGRRTRAFAPEQLRWSAEDELAALLPVLRRLPHRLDRFAVVVQHGRLGVDVLLLPTYVIGTANR